MAYDKIKVLRDNTEAILTAMSVLQDNHKASAIEMEAMAKYSGFGGVKEVQHLEQFFGKDETAARQYCKDHEMTDEMASALWHLYSSTSCCGSLSEYDSRKIIYSIEASVRTAFYTPSHVTAAIGEAVNGTLSAFGIQASSLLEPSAGAGAFLPIAAAGCKTVAFEKDIVTSLILAATHPDTDVYNNGFEEIDKVLRPNDDGERIGFDIASSNFPFGPNMKVYDPTFDKGDEIHKRAQMSINAYFPMKAIEQLENGGILAFITSRYFADSSLYTRVREWLCQQGNLLAAVRLPDTLFMDGSGVEVGADLVIFQRDIHKRGMTLDEKFYTQTIQKKICGEVVEQVNRLLCLPNKTLYTDIKVERNQFGKMMPKLRYNKGNEMMQQELSSMLKRTMQPRFCKSAWLYGHDTLRRQFEKRWQLQEAAQREAVIKDNDKAKRMDGMKKAAIAAKRRQMQPLYNRLVNAYNALDEYERHSRKENADLRSKLNAAYDEFVGKFGTLHDNDQWMHLDNDWLLALALEIREQDGTYSKADIFDHPIAFRVLKDGEVFTPTEALVMSLNECGSVNMEYMKKITSKSDAEIYGALRGEIFAWVERTPGTGTLAKVWQHKQKMFSGNIYEKIDAIDEFVKHHGKASDLMSEEFFRWYSVDTREALYEMIPRPIPFEDIDIQLGTRWVDVNYFVDFARDIFHCDPFEIVYYEGSKDGYFIKDPDWKFKDGDGGRMGPWSVYAEKARKRYSGFDVLRYALNDQRPTVTFTSMDVTYTDSEGSRLLSSKVEKIRKEFRRWIKTSISNAEKDKLADQYNRMYNGTSRPTYDGSLQTFPGLSFQSFPFKSLYQSQLDCIWMFKQLFGGVCWNVVGGGKTMIMIVTAMEMKRLGICQKPLIIGMKANVAQIAETARKAYPNAKILFPNADEYKEKNRREFFNKIKNNDWDLIILSHTQFGQELPQSPEIQAYVMDEELTDLRSTIDILVKDGDKDSKRKLTGLQTRLDNLEVKREQLQETINSKADDALDFHTMGFDFILVDEYQEFKNLGFATQHERVRGIGNSKGSNRAFNLLCAIRDIQLRHGNGELVDGGAVFASGTVVSNSLTELYSVFRYLRPVAMRKQKTRSFDAWAAQFAEKSCDYELDITGQVKQNERFRRFVNVPELSRFLHDYCDYRSREMIGLDTPTPVVVQDFSDPTSEQQMMLDRLVEYAGGADWDCLGLPESVRPDQKDDSKGDPRMLIATSTSAKVALDPRCLADGIFTDDPDNKASRCARNVADMYRKYDEHKGVQFIFCDLSTPNADKDRKVQWSIYDDVRRKLMDDYGIPESEIAFIHDNDSPTKKEKLFADMNSGVVRVVFGSTKKLGTGVNAQKRAVAVHHLDIPWKPADLEQREGRAIRTGNEVKLWGNNEVKIFVYGTNRTLDAYRFSLLNQKARFIEQIANGTTSSRHIDEGAMDGDSESNSRMDFAEYVALLSGNTDLLEMAKLKKKIEALESDRAVFERSVHQARYTIGACQERIEKFRRTIDKFENDLRQIGDEKTLAINAQLDLYKRWCDAEIERKQREGEAFKPSDAPVSHLLIVPSAKEQSVEEQGRALMSIRKNYANCKPEQVGEWAGLPIMVRTVESTTGASQNLFTVQLPNGEQFPSAGISLGNSFASAVHCWDNTIADINAIIKSKQREIENNEQTIAAQSKLSSLEWDQADELAALTSQRDTLDAKIHKQLDDAKTEAEKKAQEAQGSSKSNKDKRA